MWAAVARWLSRSHAFGHANIVLGEYEALGRRLSMLAANDVLKCCSDLLEKPWYTENQYSGGENAANGYLHTDTAS